MKRSLLPPLISLISLISLTSLTSAIPLHLSDIKFSDGHLKPPFASNLTQYALTLGESHLTSLGVSPLLEVSHYHDLNYPVVKINGHRLPSPIGAHSDIPLTSSSETIEISVCDPTDEAHCEVTQIYVDASRNIPVPHLTHLDLMDDNDQTIVPVPEPPSDVSDFTAVVPVHSESVSLSVRCGVDDKIYVNEVERFKGDKIKIKREKTNVKQNIEIICEAAQGKKVARHSYQLVLRATPPKGEAIPRPSKVMIAPYGHKCSYDHNLTRFSCPMLEDPKMPISVVAEFTEQYRYTIVDDGIEVRLVKSRPSVSFSPSTSLAVRGQAAELTGTWPLHFDSFPAAPSTGWLGLLLTLLLLLNLISLTSILTVSNLMGVGSPCGGGEIGVTLVLLLQFFCFSDFIRGEDTVLSRLCWHMKLVTVFWPLPWGEGKGGVDVGDLDNAYGCLFWCFILLLSCFTCRLLVKCKFSGCDAGYTNPLRLSFGHWEARVMTLLCFPTTTASMTVFCHGTATGTGITIAALWVSVNLIFTFTSLALVYVQVSQERVQWVFESDENERNGQWIDSVCTQLTTEPTSRALAPLDRLFEWKWVSTVADIIPVHIKSDPLMSQSLQSPEVSTTQSPHQVTVVNARSPAMCCRQQRLVAGLFTTSWLDILFTYEALTSLNSAAREVTDDTQIPLTVKRSQLTGPIAGGRLFFFFDGARMPFIRVCEILLRLFFGLFMGVTIVSDTQWLNALCFACVCLVSLACLIYTAVACPYTRTVDNWLIGAVLTSTSLTSMGLCIAAAVDHTLWALIEVLLWMTILVCVGLALYSLLITISLFIAIIAPPLEETKLLERLCNCEVTLADDSQQRSVTVAAYNKYACRDYKAQCSPGAGDMVVIYPTGDEPTLEFNLSEMMKACDTGNLRTPVVCVYLPTSSDPLDYRQTNIYDRGAMYPQLTQFLRTDASLGQGAHLVANNICRQLASVGNHLAVVTIIPAPLYPNNRGRVYAPSGAGGDYA
eukprot:GHVN01104497.1.p1 GENE.GHVN01104497.1~~GHVN01104497.1.p1  ORF type:complete len:998 (-),score=210.37 GHVN01104497.1:437-3430(-)